MTRPADARKYGQYYLLTSESFASSRNGEIWRKFSDMAVDDPQKILQFVTNELGIDANGKFKEAFLDLQSVTKEDVANRAHAIAIKAYADKVVEVVRSAVARYAEISDAASLCSAVVDSIESIRKPPGDLPKDVEPSIADETADGQPEIDERYLHVPGFIDDVVDYSMTSAFVPNRALSFAGALALTAHLMGRRYTDSLKTTRSNLFIFALGPSGCGKDWPRRINESILSANKLSQSAFGSFESGQALEELLFRSPSALVQYDECQKLMQEMRNPNGLGQSIVKFMMTLFTSSGTNYHLRSKALEPEKIGRVIEDPSLTIFGTGNAEATYRALTREVIEEGLLGRCLMLDTGVVNKSNDFDGGRPDLPSFLIEAARAIAFPVRDFPGADRELVVVPYAKGTKEMLKDIKARIKQCENEAKKKQDFVGEALWPRTPEKVSKLALIYAVSANRTDPVITCEALGWSWEFVQMQMARLTMRVEQYMASGKVDEGCQRLMSFLTRKGGACKRRDFMNANRGYDAASMRAIEETLQFRGQIEAIQYTKGSIFYKLVGKAGRKGK